MRNFFMYFVAWITKHPRYHPEEYEVDKKLHWSKDLWISNLFRAYEWLFGRGFGIRKEAVSTINSYIPLSFEAKVVYEEVKLRRFIREWVNFILYPFIFSIPYVNIGLAIALDTSTVGTATSTNPLTWSHTCTGSNLDLIVIGLISGVSLTINTPTYNGTNMTLVGSQRSISNLKTAMYFLLGPSTGSNTISIGFSQAGGGANGAAVSYSGVKQSGQPDAVNGGTNSAGSNPSTTVTTVADNCWVVGGIGSSASVTANLTDRQDYQTPNTTENGNLQDTNGPVHPAGAQAVGWTAGNTFAGFQAASFSPAGASVASASPTHFLSLLGIGG